MRILRNSSSVKSPFFLLASGYVRPAKDAEKLFEARADMVGIADPTRNDPEYIAKIAEQLVTLLGFGKT